MNRKRWICGFVAAVVATAGCDGDEGARAGDGGDAAADIAGADADAGVPADSCAAGRHVAVATTDFVSGGVAYVAIEDGTVQEIPGLFDSDPQIRANGCDVFLLGRTQTSDNVTVFRADGASLAFVRQFSVAEEGPWVNPHDLALVGERTAYVTAYEQTALRVVDVVAGTVTGRIDLAAFADMEDGIPEMDSVRVRDGRAVVSVQRLDRNNFFTPTGPGKVVVIETATGTVLSSRDLGFAQPFGPIVETCDGRWLVAQVGTFGATDGGVEILDAVEGTATLLATEASLGGDASAVALCDASHGFAIVNDAEFNTHLVTFDPATGERTGVAFAPTGFVLAGLVADCDGRVIVGDRTMDAPGLRVFRCDGTQATSDPIPTGALPPQDIVLVP